MSETKKAETRQINRLEREKSPYLLQHAHNPVDWHAWGEEAFAKARRENKPIFLSIGYSTCHWCHVMAHESFEDEGTAAIMNREFINIKVDRKERPDVDRVYMTFVQATTGGGGWPMSVWLTPDLKPFVGGTYFPPEDRYGQPAFKKVLQRIADAWRQNHEKISDQGTKIVDALRQSQTAQPGADTKIDPGVLQTAYEQFDRSFDPREGGFGNAPKFPRPVTLYFLTHFYAYNVGRTFRQAPTNLTGLTGRDSGSATEKVDRSDAAHSLEIALFTLRKMAAGGMHDHLGGGFHRYSVDRYWHVPHFEKMLYDQAQLAGAYLDGYQILADPRLRPLPQGEADEIAPVKDRFESVVRDILEYVARDLTSPEGGFFSAEDADSPVPVAAVYDRRTNLNPKVSDAHKAPLQKTKEGAFYVWAEKEIDDSLGADSELFKFHYGVQPHGNAPEGSDPHDEFRGQNILIERHTITETAARFKRSEDETRQSLARSRGKLLVIRSQRPRPHRDDKILASWNGLMISGYARAAQVLENARFRDIASRAARFLRSNLYDPKTGLLYRSFRNGRSQIEGFADDYAFVIQALIDLYEASFEIEWLKFAIELQETQDRLFFDKENAGYFSTSGQDKSVVLRMKDDNDSAEPAASSIAALNLLRLSQCYNDPKLDERARKTIEAFAATISHFPSAMPQMLVAFMATLAKPRQIVIAGEIDDSATKALLKEVHRHFMPNKVLILADGGEGQKYLGERNEAMRVMSPVDGKPAAYVCENFTCQAPVTGPAGLQALLISH